MDIPKPPPRPVKTLLKNALLVVLNADRAVARLLVKLHRITIMVGLSISCMSILLNPMDTAPVLALNGTLEMPVPLLLKKAESVMVILGQLNRSKTASENLLQLIEYLT